LLPKTSPQLPAAQRALASLPKRIAVQQEKEKDEMLDKLKELGNGLLGKFGLSTDMFKFDQQPGGGYNMRFQQ
jgi:predicted methyltransferase